jgi:hypothetical protein
MNKMNLLNPEESDDALWRARPAPAHEARMRRQLANRPQALGRWEREVALTRALNQLPDAPVSSNFTALVMQAVQRAPAPAAWHRRFWRALPSGWLPRLATAAAMLCLSILTFREYQTMQREKLACGVENVSRLAALPPVDWLQNFDTINRLNSVKVADNDLLLALQ